MTVPVRGVSHGPERKGAWFSFLSTDATVKTALHTSARGDAQDPALRKVYEEGQAPATVVPPYVSLLGGPEDDFTTFSQGGATGTESFRIAAESFLHAAVVFQAITQRASRGFFAVAGLRTIDVVVRKIGERKDPTTGRALLDADMTVTTRDVP